MNLDNHLAILACPSKAELHQECVDEVIDLRKRFRNLPVVHRDGNPFVFNDYIGHFFCKVFEFLSRDVQLVLLKNFSIDFPVFFASYFRSVQSGSGKPIRSEQFID